MTAPASPELDALVEALVEKKLDERFRRIDESLAELKAQVDRQAARGLSDRASILLFSADFDKAISAFIIASGAVAMGLEATIYCTFWGLTVLKKQTLYAGKPILEKMISLMLPGGAADLPASKMNMMGMGPIVFQRVMKNNNVETLPDLIAISRELGVRIVACQMAMGVMGIKPEELIDGIEFGGVASYLGEATDAKLTLFV